MVKDIIFKEKMNSLLQSEYFIAVVFTSILGIIAFVTYQMGFRKPEPEKIEEESAPKKIRTKQKEIKTKKKSEPQTVQVAAVSQPSEPSKPQKKVTESPKNSTEAKSGKKQAKKEPKIELVKETVVKAEEVVDISEWTTVVDKRAQKKQQKTVPQASTETVTQPKPKVEDVNTNQLVIGSKQPSELLTESVIQRTETKDKEDDWVTANHKSKKDKKKDKKESLTVPEVEPQVAPVVPEVKPVEKSKTKPKSKPSQNLTSAIREAIVDTLESKNPKQTLKQTSLTDSIILIEKENKRTESNQSSNESLQDVDGDDGFITITNKKSKKIVRREQ